MILGSSSHAGKSTIVAGICRIFSNRGIASAPFKSQNMSLNSYVTELGKEIGIAQAVQAFAARTAPTELMNPILLKPKANGVSQVVLLGEPYKDVKIKDYYCETDALLEKAVAAYEELSALHETVVIEGAGGAAEVNLYERDIANILLAKRLRLPIILVADIERGGVFAQVYGTISLLPEDVRPLVKGVIINKFRGDVSLFDEGRKILEELTGVPVLGVVPYADIDIPDEDSLSLGDKKASDSPIKIAILRYGHIANFTDFALLERAAAVSYVDLSTDFSGFDCVILPGSKNTVADLEELKAAGADVRIKEFAASGKPVIGICGGYQMMGETIFDDAFEGTVSKEYAGLGLLPIRTEFLTDKKITIQKTRTAQLTGPILSRMGTVHGYEIHAGVSEIFGDTAFEDEGAVAEGGLVFGTYLHGLFDNASAVDALVSYLSDVRGLPYEPVAEKGDPYDNLARHLEGCLDVEKLMEICGV